MRPVEKFLPNKIIRIEGKEHKITATYKTYGDAQVPLEINLGAYCNYCEIFDSNLDLEHIISQNQSKVEEKKYLITAWDNFLLACRRCNGRDNKSNKPVHLQKMYFPHLHNTFLAFKYLEGGLVKVNPELNQEQKEKAEAMLNLVGLDKYQGNPKYPDLKPRDKRWQHRRAAWELADRYLKKWQNQQISLAIIIDLALSKGFFSVWFTVFREYKEVRKALVNAFIGTATDCFDEDYQPIPRKEEDL